MPENLAPEAMLAVLGAGLAVYSLLPQERRLHVHLRMHILDWLVVIASLVLVHYIIFYPVLSELGLVVDLGPWRWGFTPALASYAVLLGAGVFLVIRMSSTRLSRRRIPILRRLVEALLRERRFPEMFFILESNLSTLRRAYFNEYRIPRLRKRFGPSDQDLFFIALKGGEAPWLPPAPIRSVIRKLPDYSHTEAEARELVRRLLLSEEFVAALVEARPYLGIELLQQSFHESEDFQDLWFSAMLASPRSILHYELANNQNLSGRHRYSIRPENRILSFYFKDVYVAEKRHVYRAFGGYGQSELRARRRDPGDRYNEPLDDFHEVGRWKSGFHSALRLFDIMIPEALHQGITWHMWLYYLPGFVDGILENLAPTEDVDPYAEWPTPYHFFLYDIVSMLCHWIREVEEVPVDQENALLEDLNARHDNGNIPKSAALALGVIIGKVVQSQKVDGRFAKYLLEVPLRTARDLLQNKKRPEYGRMILLSLARNGFHGWSSAGGGGAIRQMFDGVDHVLRFELEDEWRAVLRNT